MRRRDLLFASGGLLATLARSRPGVSRQPPATARVGWLAHGDTMPRRFFEQALVRLGWVQGQNLIIERRFAGSAGERLVSAAAELVAQRPDVIVALGIADARSLLEQSSVIPIVLVLATNDVIRQGLAVSLAHPGGDVTGVISIAGELIPKLVELAHELIPGARRVSILIDPRKDPEPDPAIGGALGITIISRHATRPEELDAALAAAASDGDQAVVVQFNAITIEERARVTALASRFRLPTVYPMREFAEAGGLLSYGPVVRDNFERAAALVDKILRGARPANLPIEQPTRFELVINLKTAKALGLTVPQPLLQRADEVFE